MASSSLAPMPAVQNGEENKVTIGKSTASHYRKELANNKSARGDELSADQRAFREQKLAAYSEKMKASGKRGPYMAAQLSKQLSGIQEDTTAIRADAAKIKADTSASKKGLKTAKDEISNKVEEVY